MNINKQPMLSQRQRVIVSICYMLILVRIFSLFGGNFKNLIWDSSIDSSIWFYAGALMIILGSYIAEPFFSKPSDAVVNSISVLIALLGLDSKDSFLAYNFILGYAGAILILSIATIFLNESNKSKSKKVSKFLYLIVSNFGGSKVIFSLVYLSAAFSYFAAPEKIKALISMILLWVCLTFFDLIGIMLNKLSLFLKCFDKHNFKKIGQAIGCDNPFLYTIEIDYSRDGTQSITYGDLVIIETSEDVGSIGMIIGIKQLLAKRWLDVYLLLDERDQLLNIDMKDGKPISETNTIFSKDSYAYIIAYQELSSDIKDKIKGNDIFLNRNEFIGYVTYESDINTINFEILQSSDSMSQRITEGSILRTQIYGKETLYQVIDGKTKKQPLEEYNNHGYLVGIARKLGNYNREKKELEVRKWVPKMYTPVFMTSTYACTEERLKEIAEESIGRLPGTDLDIPIKDINSLVTHNTAILGILGIGKSCLAFELIKKIVAEDIKVICIDVTNQYYHSDDGLKKYLPEDMIDLGLSQDARKELICTRSRSGNRSNPNDWGNVASYEEALDKKFSTFLSDENKRVLILNPDWHAVTKAMSEFNIVDTVDLTLCEKTRIISERLFKYGMDKGETDKARYLIVYEEAHSLVPEWNSVAAKTDQIATNGTAKVILQGRKYGLGCLIVTQRTANVNKSILNQCNTMFALRVFDDTGKNFLKNYIGQDYTNTLSTLEERHAIVVGKGLRLKQPVILSLNDRSYFFNEKEM